MKRSSRFPSASSLASISAVTTGAMRIIASMGLVYGLRRGMDAATVQLPGGQSTPLLMLGSRRVVLPDELSVRDALLFAQDLQAAPDAHEYRGGPPGRAVRVRPT